MEVNKNLVIKQLGCVIIFSSNLPPKKVRTPFFSDSFCKLLKTEY